MQRRKADNFARSLPSYPNVISSEKLEAQLARWVALFSFGYIAFSLEIDNRVREERDLVRFRSNKEMNGEVGG
jgi:hypothetical protein